jgi:hypothetical protein
MKDQLFSTFIPFDVIEKATEADPLRGPIRGIASTESQDQDGDIVIQEGLDWSAFFAKSGSGRPIPLTYEHPLGVNNIVGEATSVRIVDKDGVKATEIEGHLYLNDEQGANVWKKACAMKKAGSLRLGFSVEGRVPPGGRDGNKIIKAKIYSVAISPVPRNLESWWEPLAASILAGLKNGDYFARAEKIEGIAQGESAQGSGGIEKIVPQSIQKKVNSASWPAGITEDDILATIVAKNNPQLSWLKCCDFANQIRQLLGSTRKV